MLARFALGVEAPLITDRAVAAGREWQRGDLDLLQRFNPVLATSPAVIRADYARLVRSIRFEDAETPQDAALSALVQLLVIDDFRDGDAELLAQHFKAATVADYEARGAAARRIRRLNRAGPRLWPWIRVRRRPGRCAMCCKMSPPGTWGWRLS